MDYDQTAIAASYDSGRSYRPEILQQWLCALSAHVPPERIFCILDLGCGTGRYSEPLADHFNAQVIGIDPSEQMLTQAREKQTDSRVTYKRAHAEKLPASDDSIDMIFMSMIFHHLQDPETAVRECRRVLCRDGYVCVRNSTVDGIESIPYVGFFPSVRSLLKSDLPTRDQMENLFAGIGFEVIAHEIVAYESCDSWRSYADKISQRADSFLVRISDDEFESGLSALYEYARLPNLAEPVFEDADLFVFRRRSAMLE